MTCNSNIAMAVCSMWDLFVTQHTLGRSISEHIRRQIRNVKTPLGSKRGTFDIHNMRVCNGEVLAAATV
jgi:hypothetical protein